MEKEKKNSKKIIIVASIIILILVIIAGVGGYFVYKYIELKEPIEEKWADNYYNYIKSTKEENSSESTKIQNNSKIGFIEVEEIENPVMLVEYEQDEDKYTDIYYINNGTVTNAISLDTADVELLYEISTKKYDWYTHTQTDTTDTYKKVSTQILNSKEQTNEGTSETTNGSKTGTEYTFTKGEEISVETVDGEKISIPKFDTVFVETETEIGKVEYNENMTEKELKETIVEGVNQYKPEEEIITEEIKNKVISKESEVTAKQEEMKQAEEEKAKKEAEEKAKAEEEARKKAEEEAAKGLKVGNNIVKYGTYNGQYGATGETLIINSNGTATLKLSGSTENYVYSVGKYDFSQDSSPSYKEGIIFKNSAGEVSFALYVGNDGNLWLDPSCYVYAGN